MRRLISLGTSAAIAGVLTYGMVHVGLHFEDPAGQTPFRPLLLAIERLWSAVHGWPPLTHIRDFGPFYARAVHLLCPLLGFTLFWTLSRHGLRIHLWKPIAIALLLTIPDSYIDSTPVGVLPWVEAARTVVVLAVMLWSVEAIHPLRRRVQVALQS